MADVKNKKGIGITSGFKYLAESPIDVRFVVADETELQSIIENNAAYPGLLVWVKEPNDNKNNLRLYDGESFIEFNTQGGNSNTGMVLKGHAPWAQAVIYGGDKRGYKLEDDEGNIIKTSGTLGDVWIAKIKSMNELAFFKFVERPNYPGYDIWELVCKIIPQRSIDGAQIANKAVTMNKLGEDVLKFIDPPKEEVEAEETEEEIWTDVEPNEYGTYFLDSQKCVYEISTGYNIFGKQDANFFWVVKSTNNLYLSYNSFSVKPANPDSDPYAFFSVTDGEFEVDIHSYVRDIIENKFIDKKPKNFYLSYTITSEDYTSGYKLYKLTVAIKNTDTINNEGIEGSFTLYVTVTDVSDFIMSIKVAQRLLFDRDIKIRKTDDTTETGNKFFTSMKNIENNGPKPANDPYRQLSMDNSDNLYPGIHTVLRKNMYGNHEEIQLVTRQFDKNIIQYYEEKDEKSSYYMYRKYEIAGTEYKLIQDWVKVDLPLNFDITKNFIWELTNTPYNYIVEKSLEDSSLPEYFYVNHRYYVHKEPNGKDEEYYEDRFIIHILDMSDNKYYLAVDEKGFGYTAKDTDIIVKDCSATETYTNVVYREGTNTFSYGAINAFHNIVIPKTSWEVGKTYTLTVDKITGIPATLAYPYHIRTKLVCIDVAGNTLYEDNFGMQLYDIKFKFTIPENTNQVMLYIQVTGDTWESGVCETYNILMYEGTELKKETYLSKDIKILPEQLPDNLGASNKSYKINLLGTEWLRFAKLTDKDIFGSGIITINCYGELDNTQTPFTSSMFGVNVGYDSTGKLTAKIEPISQSKVEAEAESDGSGSGAMGSDGGSGDNAFYGLSNVRFSEDEDSIYLEGLFSAPTVQDTYNNTIVEIVIDNNSNIEYLPELEVSYTSNGDNVLINGATIHKTKYLFKTKISAVNLNVFTNDLLTNPLENNVFLSILRKNIFDINLCTWTNEGEENAVHIGFYTSEGTPLIDEDIVLHEIGTPITNAITITTDADSNIGNININLFEQILDKHFSYTSIEEVKFESTDEFPSPLSLSVLIHVDNGLSSYTLSPEYFVNNEKVELPFTLRRNDLFTIKYSVPEHISNSAFDNGKYKFELYVRAPIRNITLGVEKTLSFDNRIGAIASHVLDFKDEAVPISFELIPAVPKTEATALTSISGFEKLLENCVNKSDMNYNVNTKELVINVGGNVDEPSGYIKSDWFEEEFGIWSYKGYGKLSLGNYGNDAEPYMYAVDYSSEGGNKFISFGSWEDPYSGDQELIPITFNLNKDYPAIWLKNSTYISNDYVFSYSFRVGDSYDETYGFLSCNEYGNEIGLYSTDRNPIALFDMDLGTPYLYCSHDIDSDMLYVMFGGTMSPESYENPIMFDINESNPDIYIKDRSIISELDNINAKLDNLPVFEKEVASNSYKQVVPNNALDYALVEEIGGMSYESENLIALEDKEETQNGVTLTIKNGVYNFSGTSTNSLFTSSQKIFLPKGTYTLKEFTNNSKYAFFIQEKDSGNSKTLMSVSGNKTTSTITTDRDWNCIMYVYINGTGIDMNGIVITPMLVKGSVEPTTFEQGYSGFYNAKVERVAFEQKNLIQLQEGTRGSAAYTAEIDKEGWITLNKSKGNGDMWFTIAIQGELNIPKDKTYSARVRYYDEKIPNIGSVIFLYEGVSDTPTTRFMTLGYKDGSGYPSTQMYATKNVGKIYIYANNSLAIDNAKFKVELVENDFMNDSIKIPNENVSLKWLGVNAEDGNYNCIRYHEEDGKYYYHQNIGSYTFTGNEYFSQLNTTTEGKYRYQFYDLKNNIYKPISNNEIGIIKFELLETNSALNISKNNDGIAVDNSGNINWYIDSIQKLQDFKTYITGKTIIYKLATPEVIDISYYMTDEYLQVQENGSVKFVNEKQKAVPNKITYAIKVV